MPPDHVVGREAELTGLRDYYHAGRPVVLAAPRRYGKTSLLRALAEQLLADDAPVVIVDLYGVHSLVDLTLRLERAYSRWLRGPVRETVARLLTGAQVGLSLGPVSFGRQARPDRERAEAALHVAADLPRAIAERHERRVWVVLDEFQALFTVPHAEAILRTYVQQHGQAASYVFAGSQRSLLESMFTDQARPFYGQADRQTLGRLADADLAGLIERLFAQTERHPGDGLVALLDLAQGHPQRAMLLAHHLWRATGAGQVASPDAWLEARETVARVTAPEAQARFDAMSPNQQRAVRALAVHGSPFGATARQEIGVPSSSITAALEQLVAAGDVERGIRANTTSAQVRGRRGGHGSSRGDWRFTDPLLAEWLRARYAA